MNKKVVALTICMTMGISTGALTKANAEVNNGWINSNKGWNYYETGNMKTGWIQVDNDWYYMNQSGLMETGWLKDNETWYFMQSSGTMKTGWIKDNNDWYYLNEDGKMASNTTIDGYYLGANGAWVEKTSGNNTTEDETNLKDLNMKTEKSIYELGTKEINVYINNYSKQAVYYGLQYDVEKFENEKWVKVPFKEEPMFIEIAYIVEPGKTSSQVISLSNLEKLTVGKYRIVKSGGAITAEFELK